MASRLPPSKVFTGHRSPVLPNFSGQTFSGSAPLQLCPQLVAWLLNASAPSMVKTTRLFLSAQLGINPTGIPHLVLLLIKSRQSDTTYTLDDRGEWAVSAALRFLS